VRLPACSAPIVGTSATRRLPVTQNVKQVETFASRRFDAASSDRTGVDGRYRPRRHRTPNTGSPHQVQATPAERSRSDSDTNVEGTVDRIDCFIPIEAFGLNEGTGVDHRPGARFPRAVLAT